MYNNIAIAQLNSMTDSGKINSNLVSLLGNIEGFENELGVRLDTAVTFYMR